MPAPKTVTYADDGLTVALLGPPRIGVLGADLEVDTRKAIALLAYLAVAGGTQGRDSIAGFLWPDYEQDRARAALRRTLSVLRRALGDRWLVTTRTTVRLDLTDAWLDVAEWRALARGCGRHEGSAPGPCPMCVEPLMKALDLFRGDFLAGFALRDSAPFDDWQFFEAESLRSELGRVLERLVGSLAVTGRFDEAVRTARRWVALDVLNEAAHRELMRMHAYNGDRTAALRQYRVCVRFLDEELGVSPLEETSDLYSAIEQDRLAPPDSMPAPAPVRARASERSAATIPLVGRATDRDRLLELYRDAAGGGRVVIVEGEAGIGKTRLAEDFLETVEDRGARTIRVRCHEGESELAFGAIGAALRQALDYLHPEVPLRVAAEAARLVPELAADHPDLASVVPLDKPGAQLRFFEGVSELITTSLAGHEPGILFVDDAQWIDAGSLDVLGFLARRVAEHALLLVLTWRKEDVAAQPALRRLAEEGRSGAAAVLHLSRLSAEDVAELATAVGLPATVHHRLHEETEGVPFFVVEYAHALTVGEHPSAGDWPLPSGVREVLTERVDSVSEVARQVVAAAAAVGRSFDVDLVRHAGGRREEEAVVAIEELLAARIIREVQDSNEGVYDFSHDKLRAVVYEATTPARRRLLHRRLAEALQRRRGIELAGAIARHYEAAGHDEAAAEHHVRAGDHARGLYANSDAIAHYRSALALGHPDGARLHAAIGDLLMLLGDYAGALAGYETAAAHGDAGALQEVEHKLGRLHHRRGDWERSEAHLEAALALLPVEASAQRARILADRALTARYRGDDKSASSLATEALDWATRADDAAALAQAHNMLGILMTGSGGYASAREHLERSVALAQTLPEDDASVAALNNLALLVAETGDPRRAVELGERALELCSAQGDLHREAALHNNLADFLRAAGDHDAAMVHLKRSAALFAEVGEEPATQPAIWKLVEWN